MKKYFVILVAIMAVTTGAFAQNQLTKVSGIVSNHSGAPLPGTSIVVKGTNIGSTSDMNGKYSLNVPENAILEFSFFGYDTQEITVENRQLIDVMLGTSRREELFRKAQKRDDHLKPVRGIFDIYHNIYDWQIEYYLRVCKVLFNGLSDSPTIRFHVMPSFTPENVLVIEFDRDNDKYNIIYHICQQMIWNNEQWENVKVSRFKTEIDKESVKIIKTLFGKAIAQVSFPPAAEEGEEVTIMADGIKYYFSIWEYGQKSGVVHSPNEGTKMGKLVAIGNKLIELTVSNKELVKFDDKLQKEIEELIDELK